MLESIMDVMKIKIYLEYCPQDHQFEEKNMIWSSSWNFNFKIRIQDMALGRHDSITSWIMVDQGLEHAIKWRVLCVPQTITIDDEDIEHLPTLGVEIEFKLVNTWNIKIVLHEIMWSCGTVSFSIIYALWTSLLYVCLCTAYVGYFSCHGHASKVRSHVAHEMMTSSGDHIKVEKTSSRWASLKDYMLEACRPFGDNGVLKMFLNEAHP
jgi:hypothetical protein